MLADYYYKETFKHIIDRIRAGCFRSAHNGELSTCLKIQEEFIPDVILWAQKEGFSVYKEKTFFKYKRYWVFISWDKKC